jgi:3-oxoadipate enol-lactonase
MTDPGFDSAAPATSIAEPFRPLVPPGRYVELAGRGTTFVRELSGPVGAPTVILLHGWTATADLNWFPSYAPLAREFRMVALDQRGHGLGIRSRKAFKLEDCADDAVALIDELGIDQAVFVGYSMGGAVAQLVWHRHRDRVRSLVLGATSRNFNGTREEQMTFLGLGGLAAMARVMPLPVRRRLVHQYLGMRAERGWEEWAIEQVRPHDWTAILEAGRAIGSFSSREWVGSISVPTSVIITNDDHVVPPRRQLRLAESLHEANVFRIAGDHDVCVTGAERFVPTLIAAIKATGVRG